MTATLPPNAVTLGYSPQPMQAVFHTAPADEVLYGGSAGGGKSDALINHGLITCAQVPRSRAVIMRRTSPELQELRDRAAELMAPHPEVASYSAREDRWVFQNGSSLRFSHLQHYEDVHKHQGAQYSLILFDEWTHFLPKQTEYLKSRNRSGEGHWSRILGASNPGSIGHAYIKDAFVTPRDERGNLIDNVTLAAYYDFERGDWVKTKPYAGQSPSDVKELGKTAKWEGRYDFEAKAWLPCPPWNQGKPAPFVVWIPNLSPEEVKANEERQKEGLDPISPSSRCYIPARLKDNKYLYADGSYQAKLLRMGENERKALLDGDWDIFEGAFFPDFRPALHVIDGGWRPPAHWSVWASMDWGRSVPSAVYWHAQDPETQHIVTYREMYGIYRTDREIAENIVFLTGDEDVRYIMADPAMWRADGNDDAISHADTFDFYFSKEGSRIKMMKADNNRVAGWARCKDLMAIDPTTKDETSDDPVKRQGIPYWRCTADCRNLIRTIPQQVYDEDKQDDLDTEGDDHAVDSWRYGMQSSKSLNARRRYKINPVKVWR
jgi:hypothetical protein